MHHQPFSRSFLAALRKISLVTAYRLRGIAYKNVGETAKAEADYEKARQLGFPGKQ